MKRLARLDRNTEDVFVLAVVVPERELGNVERQILRAYLVIRAHDAALEDRPEAFDGIRMHRAVNVLTASMIHGLVRESAARVAAADAVIRGPLVGADKAHATRDGLAHEVSQRHGIDRIDHASNDVSLALDCADNGSLTRTNTAAAAFPAAAFVLVLVLEVAAYECLVHFDDAEQLQEFSVLHRDANAMAHVPRGFVGAEAEHAKHLQGTHAFLARRHHVDDSEPIAQRLVRVLKDCIDQYREAIRRLLCAVITLPMKRLGAVRVSLKAAARATHDAGRPTVINQVQLACVFVRELAVELCRRHLVNPVVACLRVLGHGTPPISVEASFHV